MIKKSFGEFISDKFDIPLNGISAVPQAQFIGNTQLSIEGCVGIKKYKDDEWSNIRSYRIQVDPARLNDIFQNLVNHGVLDREKNGKSSNKEKFDRFIAVKANICANTYSDNVNIFEVDPDLAENLLDVVREFENPALK